MFSHILFDLDGTLVNTEPGIFQGICYATQTMQLPTLPPAVMKKFLGPPLHDSFAKYCGLDEAEALRAVDIYREYYREKGVLDCALYPHMEATLRQLKEQGYHLYVATSKPTVFAERILKEFGVAELFTLIQGSDLNDPHSTGKVRVIEKVLDAAQVSKASCVLVGDTRYDGEGAKQAGIAFLPVLYGFGELAELTSFPHIGVAETAPDIARLIAGKAV